MILKCLPKSIFEVKTNIVLCGIFCIKEQNTFVIVYFKILFYHITVINSYIIMTFLYYSVIHYSITTYYSIKISSCYFLWSNHVSSNWQLKCRMKWIWINRKQGSKSQESFDLHHRCNWLRQSVVFGQIVNQVFIDWSCQWFPTWGTRTLRGM